MPKSKFVTLFVSCCRCYKRLTEPVLLILNTKSVYKIFHHMAELSAKLVIHMPPTSENDVYFAPCGSARSFMCANSKVVNSPGLPKAGATG